MLSALWAGIAPDLQKLVGVLFVAYWTSESLIAWRMRASGPDRSDDRGSLRLLAIVFTLSWWVAVACLRIRRLSFVGPGVFDVGILVLATAQLLRWWSVATLGRLFTVNVAIRQGHRVVEQGPYRYVRHPSYTAIILFHLGAGLCLGNAAALLLLTLPTTAALLNRIRVEEDVLAAGLGEPYRAYMRRTPRLVPGLY